MRGCGCAMAAACGAGVGRAAAACPSAACDGSSWPICGKPAGAVTTAASSDSDTAASCATKSTIASPPSDVDRVNRRTRSCSATTAAMSVALLRSTTVSRSWCRANRSASARLAGGGAWCACRPSVPKNSTSSFPPAASSSRREMADTHTSTGPHAAPSRSPSFAAMLSSARVHAMFLCRISRTPAPGSRNVNLASDATSVSRGVSMRQMAATCTACAKPTRQALMVRGSSSPVVSSTTLNTASSGPQINEKMGPTWSDSATSCTV